MEENNKKIIGIRIRELRDKLGLFQSDLAEKLHMKRTNISKYENGTVIPPSDTLAILADILHTSTDFLLGKTDDPLPFYSRLSLDFRELLAKMSKDGEFFDYLKDDVIDALERFKDQFEENFFYTPDELAKEMDEDYSLYFKGELYGDIINVAIKHGVVVGKNKNSLPYNAEKEFVDNIELSDEELIRRFPISVDGRPLSAKETKKILAQVRLDRQFEND